MQARTFVLGTLVATGCAVASCRDRTAPPPTEAPPAVDPHPLIEGCPPTNVGVAPRASPSTSARDAGPQYDGAFRRFTFGGGCKYTGFSGACPLDRIEREAPEPGARSGAVVLKIHVRWPRGWEGFGPRETPSVEIAVPESREADIRMHLEKLGALLCDGNRIDEGTCNPEAHRVHVPPLPWTIARDREDPDRWASTDVLWSRCVSGAALACDRLAQHFVEGRYLVTNAEQARRLATCSRKLAKDACDAGSAEACIDAMTLANESSVPFDDAGAVDEQALRVRACELGSAQGCSSAAYRHRDHALTVRACELGRVRDCWDLVGREPKD